MPTQTWLNLCQCDKVQQVIHILFSVAILSQIWTYLIRPWTVMQWLWEDHLGTRPIHKQQKISVLSNTRVSFLDFMNKRVCFFCFKAESTNLKYKENFRFYSPLRFLMLPSMKSLSNRSFTLYIISILIMMVSKVVLTMITEIIVNNWWLL